jgi:hypothetical protein
MRLGCPSAIGYSFSPRALEQGRAAAPRGTRCGRTSRESPGKPRADEQGLAETRRGLPWELLSGSPGEEPAAAQAHRRRGAVWAGRGSSCRRSGCRGEELAPGEGICSEARSAAPLRGAGSPRRRR